MANESRGGRFLVIDDLPESRCQELYGQLRGGQIHVEELHTKEDGTQIRVPDGLIHHWVGVAFLSHVTLSQTLTVLQDYDNHKIVYSPDVRRSKLLEHNGNEFKIYLQLYQKSIVTVVINANFDVQFTRLDSTRAINRSYSTRIAEVQNSDKPDEHELPVGNDHGYLWRLYNYWRILEKDDGVYVQVESIALTRSVPTIFAPLVNPLLGRLARGVLSNLLKATRTAVSAKKTKHASDNLNRELPAPTFAPHLYNIQPLEFGNQKLDAGHGEARNVGSAEPD